MTLMICRFACRAQPVDMGYSVGFDLLESSGLLGVDIVKQLKERVVRALASPHSRTAPTMRRLSPWQTAPQDVADIIVAISGLRGVWITPKQWTKPEDVRARYRRPDACCSPTMALVTLAPGNALPVSGRPKCC